MNLISARVDNFLQSPSLLITYFFVIVLSIIVSIVHIELLSVFYKVEFSKSRKLLFVIAGLFFSSISRIFFSIEQRKIIFLCLLPLCVYWILNLPFNKAIVFSCIANTSAVIVAILVYNFSRFINPCFIKEFPILDILIISIIILIESALIYFLKNKNVVFNEMSSENCKVKSLVIICLFLLLLLSHNSKSLIYSNMKPLYLVMIELGIIVFYLVITLMNVGVRIENSIELKQIQILDANNKMLNLSTKKTKKFKNDFISIIQDIGGYIKYNDFDALKAFYSEIMREYKSVNICSFLNPNTVNESAIYNILCTKYYIAKKYGIEVELKIRMDFTKLKIKTYELSRILGIFLDNAIEATVECEDKHIYLYFVSEENRDVIKISNTYNQNKEIDFNKIFVKGYSTKEKNTGLGLWKVKQILLKHTNLDLYTHKEANIFIQELYIYHE